MDNLNAKYESVGKGRRKCFGCKYIDGGNKKTERVILLECSMVNHIYYQHVGVRTLIIVNRKNIKRGILRLLVLIQENYLTMVVSVVVEKDELMRCIDEK